MTNPVNAMKQHVSESTAGRSASVPTYLSEPQGGAASAASLRWPLANGTLEETSVTASNAWDVLGVDVQAWKQMQAVAVLDARVSENRPTCVAFANTNLLNIAVLNARLRSALRAFTVFNDGIGMNIAARILYGKAFPSNLNGTDFIPFYLSNTVHRHRIFLVGARPEVIERAARAFQQRFASRHEIVGYTDGFSGLADIDAALDKIVAPRTIPPRGSNLRTCCSSAWGILSRSCGLPITWRNQEPGWRSAWEHCWTSPPASSGERPCSYSV